MLTVGLTGGYASGKSFVAAQLEHRGCRLIYADKLGHAVLQSDGEAYGPTLAAFGPEILADDDAIDRKKLGAVVFADPARLAQLTGFVHPAVFRLEEKMLQAIAREDPAAIAVVEAAILIETGRYRSFNRMILTACSEELQVARGMKRDHLTREQVFSRLAKQMPLEEKRRFVDYVIDTDGSKEQTTKEVERVFADLKQQQEAKP